MRNPKVAQVCAYLEASRPDVFVSWPEGRLRSFVNFHAAQGGVCAAQNGQTGHIIGVAIGWRSHKVDIDHAWTRWDDSGTCIWFSQFHADSPLAVYTLLCGLSVRIPEWRTLNIFGVRHGRRVRIRPELLERLAGTSKLRAAHGH
jgi:hypothetical protein